MKKNASAIRPLNSRFPVSAVALAASTVMLTSSVFAADKAWSTAPTSNAFSGPNFATGNVAAPANTTLANGDALFFGTSSILFPNNDISGLSLAGITFNTGAQAFTLGGNAITLTGPLTNNSTSTQTFNNSFNFNQTQTIATNTGAITLNGGFNLGTFGLTKLGTGVLNLTSANNFSGGTTLNGVIAVGVNGALGSGPVTLNSGASQIQLGAGVNFSNPLTFNGGGVGSQGQIYVVNAGTSTVSSTINLAAPQNAGGTFATTGDTAILRIDGNNTITSAGSPVSIRLGRVIFTGAQNYTTGTVFNGNAGDRVSLQFGKVASMPASGAVTVPTGKSIIVNAGGSGEFTGGDATATAGTIGGLLAGVGGQGAPVSLQAGSTLGVDTTNTALPVVFNGPWQSAGGTSAGLLKLGVGTLELTGGGVYAGSGGVTAFPLVARAGTLNLAGGTHTVTGEMVVGGTFGTVAGQPGQDATVNVTNGTLLNVSAYLSVGRGNGIGVANSALNVDNGIITAGNFSLGFNGGSAANLPKASVTLNNASTITIGTAASTNPNFNFAESLGSTGTLTMNGTSAISILSPTAIVHLGNTGNANITMNDNSSFTSGNNNANFFIGRVVGGRTNMTMNGSSSIVLTGASGGITLADGGVGVLNVASPAATVSSNALLIGHFGTTTGALYNKGSLQNLANGIFMGDGVGGYAYLRNDNAASATPNATAGNIVNGISSNSYGVVDVVSGTLSGTTVGSGFYQGVAANGQFNVLGGNLVAGVNGLANGNNQNATTAVTGAKYMAVNVLGGTLTSAGPINLANNNDAGTNGFLSLRTGGTVVADTINAFTASTTGTGSAAMTVTTVNVNPFTVISANGGTLRANAGVATASSVLVGTGVDSIQVTGDGLTVDTAGLNKSIDTVITDPQGFGVTSISLNGTGTNFVGRPLVKITDSSGSGATAVADWDPVTQQVTGITVTAPGSNYAQPAVTIYGGGGSVVSGTGTIALTGAATIDFTLGGGITKTGSGTLSLTAANAYTGTTVIKNGVLSVKTASAGVSAATPLLSGPGGTDIQNGSVIFDYTGDTSPVAGIRTLLAGSFTAGAGVMNTGQIRSTTATTKRGIGYVDNGTGNVTLRATLFGDADLDGGVSINDFNALAGNFGQATGRVWAQGDFDYDGGVSINDFNLLAGNFGQTLPASSEAWAGLLAFAAAHNDLETFAAITGVPEPTSLGLIAAGATLGLRRRRRSV